MERSFSGYEHKGRQIFRSTVDFGRITAYEETTDPYSPIDVYMTGTTQQTYAVEIKYRNLNSTADIITKDGVILERGKLESLRREAYHGRQAYYVSIFPDNTIFKWHITRTYPPETYRTTQKMNKTYCNDTTPTVKDVYHLPLQDAIKTEYRK